MISSNAGNARALRKSTMEQRPKPDASPVLVFWTGNIHRGITFYALNLWTKSRYNFWERVARDHDAFSLTLPSKNQSHDNTDDHDMYNMWFKQLQKWDDPNDIAIVQRMFGHRYGPFDESDNLHSVLCQSFKDHLDDEDSECLACRKLSREQREFFTDEWNLWKHV